VTETDEARALDQYGLRFAERMTAQAPLLEAHILSGVMKEVPELVDGSPRHGNLLAQVITANLENILSAVRCQAPLDVPFVPSVNTEYARFLAQRGVPADRLLLGYQLVKRAMIRAFIDAAAELADNQGDVPWVVNGVLAYLFAYGDVAIEAAIGIHASAQAAWPKVAKVSLIRRVAAVLDGEVADPEAADRLLGYPVSGRHVAFIGYGDRVPIPQLDMGEVDRRLRLLPGGKEILVVPRDELTIFCWVSVPENDPVDQWIALAEAQGHPAPIAFGEPARGIEGFRLSHRQAQAAGAVLALANNGVHLVRYRDVAAVSFLAKQPVECRGWLSATLGDLAGDGEEREQLRHTLLVFLEEGENANAASQRLFVHRNTIRYRVERAKQMLPAPLEKHRLDVALALRYCRWVDGDRPPRTGARGRPGG
jgi:hypothetical protein